MLKTKLPLIGSVMQLQIVRDDTTTSLDGLPNLPNLNQLEISRNDGLASLDGLPDLPKLEYVALQSEFESLFAIPMEKWPALQWIALNDSDRSRQEAAKIRHALDRAKRTDVEIVFENLYAPPRRLSR